MIFSLDQNKTFDMKFSLGQNKTFDMIFSLDQNKTFDMIFSLGQNKTFDMLLFYLGLVLYVPPVIVNRIHSIHSSAYHCLSRKFR